jgi:hypothetical protein
MYLFLFLTNFILCREKARKKAVKIFFSTVSVSNNASHTSPIQNCHYKGLYHVGVNVLILMCVCETTDGFWIGNWIY